MRFFYTILLCCLTFGLYSQKTAADYFNQGYNNNEDGNYEQAIEAFTKAIELDYHLLAYCYNNRAFAKEKLGLLDEAISDFKIALDLDKSDKYISSNYCNLKKRLLKSYKERTNVLDKYILKSSSLIEKLENDIRTFEKIIVEEDKKIHLYKENIELCKEQLKESDKYKKKYEADSDKYYAIHKRQNVLLEFLNDSDSLINLCKIRIELTKDNYMKKTIHLSKALKKFSDSLTIQENIKKKISDLRDGSYNDCLFMLSNIVQKSQPQIYAVAIGIESYQNDLALSDLNYPKNQVFNFARVLERNDFTNGIIPVLVDEEATQNNIIKTLENTFGEQSNVTSNDLIIFYYSGHGKSLSSKREIGICPYDYFTEEQLISDDKIIEIINKSRAKHKVCIIESCRSKNTAYSSIPPPDKAYFDKKRQLIPEGLVYITSCESDENSYEVETLKGGVFSHYFLKAISGEDKSVDINNDGLLTVQELFDYIETNTKQYTKGGQNPCINEEGYKLNPPIFILPKN